MQDNRLKRSLGYALVRAFRVVNRATNRAVRPLGMSAEQAHILLVLWFEGPLKIGELQKMLTLSSSTLTGAIDRMEKAGLVRRTPDPEDGRAWIIEPGAIDNKTRRQMESVLGEMEEQCFAPLSAAEKKQLFQLLEKITLE
jgi:MarR family transcriptional regulator, organic hydroperoxide resistance regulator